jgi:hypothetical protein
MAPLSKKAKRKPRFQPPVRLDAKPTRPHGGKHGARGYDRLRANASLHRELGSGD